jgi:hypothetical protein
MPKIVELETEQGPVYVEVAEFPVPAGQRELSASSNTDAPRPPSIGKFEKAIAVIKPAANAVMATLEEINRPDEVQMEFGVSIDGKLGIGFLTSLNSGATFKVAVTWRNPAPVSKDATADEGAR